MEQYRSRRLLIVDAEPTLHAAATTILQRASVEVDHAPDLPSATMLLAEHAYVAVLVDAVSTHCDGADLMRVMQPVAPRPVLVLAANDLIRVEDPGLVSLIIRKPYDVQMVIGVLLACGTAAVPPAIFDPPTRDLVE